MISQGLPSEKLEVAQGLTLKSDVFGAVRLELEWPLTAAAFGEARAPSEFVDLADSSCMPKPDRLTPSTETVT